MPTYQYQCPHCGHEFEEFQSITEDAISKCPKCGRKPKRIITGGIGFLLKGSGFYKTDYRPESYKAAERKDKEASASSQTKADPKPSSSPTSPDKPKA